MQFTPGNPKPEGSGRQQGTPNKVTRIVADRLAELGCDPIEGLVLIAADAKTPVDVKVRAYSELCQYCYPRLRAIEHTGALPVEVHTSGLDLFRARIDAIIARRQEAEGGGQFCSVRARVLYQTYRKWAEEVGERAQPETICFKRLGEQGFSSRHTRAGNVYDGIGLLAEGEGGEGR